MGTSPATRKQRIVRYVQKIVENALLNAVILSAMVKKRVTHAMQIVVAVNCLVGMGYVTKMKPVKFVLRTAENAPPSVEMARVGLLRRVWSAISIVDNVLANVAMESVNQMKIAAAVHPIVVSASQKTL